MQELLEFFGHGFCHQIPERTFEAGGYLFSVCARDTGIYLGFFFAILAAFLIYARSEKKPGNLPPARHILILALLMLPFAVDGLTSYMGLRETTNTIRYITGLAAGIAVGSLIVPFLFATRKDADVSQKAFTSGRNAATHLCLCIAAGLLFLFVYPHFGFLSPLFAVFAFVSIPFSLNLAILTLSRRFFPRHTRGHWFMLTTICLLLVLVEVTALGLLRDWVVQTVFGGVDLSSL